MALKYEECRLLGYNAVSKELVASVFKVKRISELGTIAITSHVSEEPVASRFRIERTRELGTALTVISLSSETSVLTITTRRHIQKDGILRSHRHENYRSCILNYSCKQSTEPSTIRVAQSIRKRSDSSLSKIDCAPWIYLLNCGCDQWTQTRRTRTSEINDTPFRSFSDVSKHCKI
jgi:hypothetical protein